MKVILVTNSGEVVSQYAEHLTADLDQALSARRERLSQELKQVKGQLDELQRLMDLVI